MPEAHHGTLVRALLVCALSSLSGCGLVEGPVQVVTPPDMVTEAVDMEDMGVVDGNVSRDLGACAQTSCPGGSGVTCAGAAYTTCSLDDSGCAVTDEVECARGEVCVDMLGCVAEVTPCENACPSAGVTTCDPDDPNVVLTCIIDPRAPECLIWNRQSCDGEVLGCRVDGGGAASCARVRCPATQCTPGDQRCADAGTVQTCAVDTDDPLGCTTFKNSECPPNRPVCNADKDSCDTTCVRECEPNIAASECLDANAATSCEEFMGPNSTMCSTLIPAPCQDGEACDAGTGACAPHDDLCPDVGDFCTPEGDVITCALEDNLRRATGKVPCPEGRACEGGVCVCANECVAGRSRCSADGAVQVCARDDATGCLRFQTVETCSGRQRCVASTQGPIATAACVCQQDCTIGEFSCSGSTTVRCIADNDGCAFKETVKDECVGKRAGTILGCGAKDESVLQCALVEAAASCTRESVSVCAPGTKCVAVTDPVTGMVTSASCLR